MLSINCTQEIGVQNMSILAPYPDLAELKKFYKHNPLHACIKENTFSAAGTYEFFVNLAYTSEDIGRCISLMINVINLSMLEIYDESNFRRYRDPIINGELISAITPEFRNKGLSKKLLDYHKYYALNQRCDYLIVQTQKDSFVEGIYQKNGFQVVENMGYYRKKR